ncbi:MAG TPA: peptidase E [Acidimicrobiales bacterium]|nr:peptidase E [Acidimicrobiales bacterium]
MTASAPTILATSGGLRPGRRTRLEFGPLLHFAVELACVSGRAPRVCYLGTAGGDQHWYATLFADAGRVAGVEGVRLDLFPMVSADDPAQLLGDADVVWVGGGSVANLLALWRLHELGPAFRAAWEAGVVLAGVSAGSVCWHVGGTTDSFGPELQPVTDGLGLVPYANGVHYDSEPQRRPLLHRLVADGTLPEAYATDDGVDLLYRGTELVEAVSEVPGKGAYLVTAVGGVAHEERLEPRLLGGTR